MEASRASGSGCQGGTPRLHVAVDTELSGHDLEIQQASPPQDLCEEPKRKESRFRMNERSWCLSEFCMKHLFLCHCQRILYYTNIVQEAVIKTIPKIKKCKKTKWLSEEALQIAVKRREVKGKGEKERYKHLNAEFQRIARREKKAFLSDQCKEIEENNRMGKTRDLFKKIRDTKGTFHAKIGSIKDRNVWT
ncbi:uncharacterized protein [Bos taurus]|uniref:uncharacterized protein isoform X2 n=1 Tax=Bos taurus TaxID=9913 RepID=UPI0028CB26BD|nr:uncharacterized protein LOC132344881 isoform X2 [Bos taurus]